MVGLHRTQLDRSLPVTVMDLPHDTKPEAVSPSWRRHWPASVSCRAATAVQQVRFFLPDHVQIACAARLPHAVQHSQPGLFAVHISVQQQLGAILLSGCGAWRRQCSSCRCSSWPRDGPGRRRRPPLPSWPPSSAALRLLRWSTAGGRACGRRYRRRRKQHSSSHDGCGARQRELRLW